MLTLAGKPTPMVRPKLMFATHRQLDEALRATTGSGSNVESLMALAAIVAVVVPTTAGPMPLGDMGRLREWAATAYDALASGGATDQEIVDAGVAALNWLTDQLPRVAIIEAAAGNSSAQTATTTGT